jgi:hypothetical protein
LATKSACAQYAASANWPVFPALIPLRYRPEAPKKRDARACDPFADDGCTMLNSHAPTAPAIPLLAAADLQDHLLIATNDLDRLQDLLSHACDELMQGFHGAAGDIQELISAAQDTPSQELFDNVMQHLGGAITALQFQDMASQLIAHTNKRLRSCADRIAHDAMGDDDGETLVEPPPLRPNPVTQDEMDAGSIELF